MNKAFKFKLQPNNEQKILIDKTIGCARLVYNLMLNDKINHYKETKKMLNNTPAQYKQKPEYEFLKEVDSLALANSQQNLNSAYLNFFRNPKIGFPKFKSKKKSKLRYTTNNQKGTIDIIYDKDKPKSIKLPKLGNVKAIIHREINKNIFTIKSATIEHAPTNEYFISILVEYDYQIPNKKLDKDKSLGLDYSSPNFYVDSNGNSPEKEKYFRENEEKLAKEQRKLSLMIYNSNNYKKQKIKVAKIYKRISNCRLNFCHQLSHKLSNEYDIICIEDLNLQNIAQSLKLGKSTNDNGFGLFRNLLQYKLELKGKKLIKVDKWFASSKICNHCGSKNTKLALGDRTWVCKECGNIIERDYNAAKNILQEGLKQIIDQELVKKPVDTDVVGHLEQEALLSSAKE